MTHRIHVLTLPALTALLLAASTAGAQAPGTVFAEAQAAMRRKDYAVACPKLEEFIRLQPGAIGAQITLSQCYEGAGRMASAWRSYAAARALAAKAGRADQEKTARTRVEALEGRLARLAMVLPEAVRSVPGLAIEVDGTALEASQWNVPFPVDRGKHLVAVTAPGKARWEKAVEVSADGTIVPVEVPPLVEGRPEKPVAPPPALAPVAVKVVPAAPTAPPRPAGPPFWNGLRAAGVAVTGVGLVGVGVGAAFGVMAISKKNESNTDEHCGPPTGNFCDATGKQLRNQGLTDALISSATFIPGVILVVGGVTLFGVGSRRPVEARVGVGPGSISLSGTW